MTDASSTQTLTPFIYAVSGGVPGALVTSGSPVTVTSGTTDTWVTAPLTTAKLAPGDYLIGLLYGNSSSGVDIAATTSGSMQTTTMSSDTVPDATWPGSTIYSYTLSAYVTLKQQSTGGTSTTSTPTSVCTPAPGGGCYETLGRAGYCAAVGNTTPAGTAIVPGSFLNLFIGQPTWDPDYKGATPAIFVHGTGITCDPPPPGYVDTGRKVNSAELTNPGDPAAIYEYWVPAS